jgi:thioredoxin-related protein
MKPMKEVLALLVVVLSIVHNVSGQGIVFDLPGLQEARAKAEKNRQLIFVDLYADWSGPCKAMEQSVFVESEVADFFNTHFVNLRVEINRPETEELARSYGVREFPTYIFVNKDGELVHKIVGFHSVGKLLTEARKAERKSDGFIPMDSLKSAFQEGKRESDFLYQYLGRKYDLEGPQPEILDLFLKQIPESEMRTEKMLNLISEHVGNIHSRGFEILLASLDHFPALTETQQRAVLKGIGMSKRNSFIKAVETQDEGLLERLIDAVHETSYSFETAVAEERQFRYDFAKLTGNFTMFRVIAMQEATKIMLTSKEEREEQNKQMLADFERNAELRRVSPSSGQYKMMRDNFELAAEKMAAFQLNEFAEGYLLMASYENDLQNALKWAISAVTLYETPGHRKTQALLLQKLGRRSEAKKVLRKAIKLAEGDNETVTEYQKLYKKM